MSPEMDFKMSQAERSTEERVDAVLRALQQAQPAPGMEQRITASLLRAHDAASPAKQRRTWLRSPQIAGLAVVVTATLLVSAHIYRAGTAPVKGRAAMEKAAGFSPLNSAPRTATEALAENSVGFSPLNSAAVDEGLQPRPAVTGAKAPSRTQRVSGLKAAAFSGNANADPRNANADPRNANAASGNANAALGNATAALAEKAVGFSPLNPAAVHEGLQPRPAVTGAKAPSRTQRLSGLKAAAFSGKATASKNTRAASGNTELAFADAIASSDGRAGTRDASQKAEQANTAKDFPPPPLPLTEQERLLVRLVHREDPVQLAQLAPAAREAELQREREQVHEFFKAPPMLAANFTLEPYPTPGGTQ